MLDAHVTRQRATGLTRFAGEQDRLHACIEQVLRRRASSRVQAVLQRHEPDPAPVEGHQQRVVHALLGEPGVAALHDTNGRWDLLAELRVASLAELSASLERIRGIPGVSASETSVHLHSYRA